MRSRNVFIGLVVIAGVAAGAVYYQRRQSVKQEEKFRTELVDRGAVAETVTATGTIYPVTTVQVGSQVSGIVSRLYADWNSPVKKGQLLAELDSTPFLQQVEQRRADLTGAKVQETNSEIQYKRAQRLFDEQLSAEADRDAAKAAYDAAKAQVEQSAAALKQAETNLSYTKIYSPIDGVVVARQYDIGQTVAASFQAPTLFNIAEDLTKMQVQADVDQSDIGRVAVGQTARFTVDAYADSTFTGQISQIRLNATQNQNVITYPVIIDVPNPEGNLKPKMTADVTIEVARVADVLRVPNAALRFRPIETAASGGSGASAGDAMAATRPSNAGGAPGGGFTRAAAGLPTGARGKRSEQSVYVVLASGELSKVAVKTGISDGRFTAIVSGDLKEGDRIAIGNATAKSTATGTFPGTGGPGGGGRRP